MKSLLKAPGIILSDIDDVQATGETISAALTSGFLDTFAR